MILGANSFAISQAAGGVLVTRTIHNGSINNGSIANGSISNGSLPVRYLPGDRFAVDLDYTVTGTQRAVSITEKLPTGWIIVYSNEPYKLIDTANNVYAWNISSPLSGVSSGRIQYLATIPDDAALASYDIDGRAAWFNSFSAINSGKPTGTTTTDTSEIMVSDSDDNGPTIWISDPAEEIGDGDGHLEPGEWANYTFFIEDKDGIVSDIAFVNDNPYSNITYHDRTADYISGYVHVPATSPTTTVKINATDASGNSNELSNTIYVPYYDYTAWISGKANNFTVQSAEFEPYSSASDGGWTTLHGGKPIKVPAINISYKGPANIDQDVMGPVSNILFNGLLGTGDASVTLNATPRSVNVPYRTYPVYTEGASDVSATFSGTGDMHDKTFHVILINLSETSSRIDLMNLSSIVDSMKGLTPEDIENGELGSADISTDSGTSAVNVDHTDISALQDMHEGMYALLVMDYSLPDTPCLVSVAPFVVTKGSLETTQAGPMAMPGDTIPLKENLVDNSGSEYVYIALMVPDNDLSVNLTVAGNGTLNGTTYTFDGLSMKEKINITSDGTRAGTILAIHGMAGDYVLNSTDMKNSTKLENLLMSEVNKSNMSLSISSGTTSTNEEMSLLTRPTMPTGNYTVTSIVIDENTGNITAVNQTTIQLGASYTLHLVKEWNLISLPLMPENDSIYSVFPDDVRAKIVDIWGWDEKTQDYTYYTADPTDYFYQYYPGVTTIEPGRGYWVYMNDNATVVIQGTVPENAPNKTIAIHSEWNLVGPTGLTSPTPASMYPNVVDIWGWDNSTQDYTYYTPDPTDYFYQYYPNIDNTEPGQAYWVYMP